MLKNLFRKTKNLPIFTWSVWNVFGFSLLAVAALQGWVAEFVLYDNTHISKLIFAIFLGMQILAFFRVRDLSKQIDDLRSGAVDAATVKLKPLMTRLGGQVGLFQNLAVFLVSLGLLGTAVGFKFAISEVDASAVSDPSTLVTMIQTMFTGMNYMLYTTIAGMIFGMWLTKTSLILRGAATEIVALVQEKQP